MRKLFAPVSVCIVAACLGLLPTTQASAATYAFTLPGLYERLTYYFNVPAIEFNTGVKFSSISSATVRMRGTGELLQARWQLGPLGRVSHIWRTTPRHSPNTWRTQQFSLVHRSEALSIFRGPGAKANTRMTRSLPTCAEV